jgi:hypothetical protein
MKIFDRGTQFQNCSKARKSCDSSQDFASTLVSLILTVYLQFDLNTMGLNDQQNDLSRGFMMYLDVKGIIIA